MTAVTRARMHEGDPSYPRDEDPEASLFDPDPVDEIEPEDLDEYAEGDLDLEDRFELVFDEE